MAVERSADGALYYNGEYVSDEIAKYVEAEDRRLRELAEKSVAPNTRRAYASDWDSFVMWCMSRNFIALPATDDSVARYLRWLIDRPREEITTNYRRADGRVIERKHKVRPAKPATLSRHLVSIAKAHLAAGFEDPTRTLLVRQVLRGIRNERGRKQKQKTALLVDDLKRAVTTITHPIERTENESDALFERRSRSAKLHTLRDRAILLLGWTGAFRRSEIAALDFDHIQRDTPGIAVTLIRSKTNQDGKHEEVLIAFAQEPEYCAIAALDSWLDAAKIEDGAIFQTIDRHGNLGTRIQPSVVATIVKRAAIGADLNPELFAAHSLRSGWISTAAREGRSEQAGMKVSRHKSVQVYRGYVQAATRWDGHAGLNLL